MQNKLLLSTLFYCLSCQDLIIFMLCLSVFALREDPNGDNSAENAKIRHKNNLYRKDDTVVGDKVAKRDDVNIYKGAQINGLNNSPNSTLGYMIINNNYQYFEKIVPENIISSPAITNWGTWGSWDNCSSGEYAIGFQLKSEVKRIMKGTKDNTALNGISLLCAKFGSRDVLDYPTSSVGPFGEWGEYLYCNKGLLTGYQLRSETDQGDDGDNTAANNMKGICSTTEGATEVIEGDGDVWGDWTTEQRCDNGKAICGIQTQVALQSKEDHHQKDKTSVNNVKMKCCDIKQGRSLRL